MLFVLPSMTKRNWSCKCEQVHCFLSLLCKRLSWSFLGFNIMPANWRYQHHKQLYFANKSCYLAIFHEIVNKIATKPACHGFCLPKRNARTGDARVFFRKFNTRHVVGIKKTLIQHIGASFVCNVVWRNTLERARNIRCKNYRVTWSSWKRWLKWLLLLKHLTLICFGMIVFLFGSGKWH